MIDQLFDVSKSQLQKVAVPSFEDRNLQLYIKRDDLIHLEVSGNKWRKLKFNIHQFQFLKKDKIVTFGGAYSNHLLATASACNLAKIDCIGIVRGEELTENSNAHLKRCSELGMKLKFISREEYGLRNEKQYQEELALELENAYIIPEGGANYYGAIGCQEIVSELKIPFDHLFLAQGTTTTSCGLAMAIGDKELHVIPALKGFDSIGEMAMILKKTGMTEEVIEEYLSNVVVHPDYHFGGYGKTSEELKDFVSEVFRKYGVPLDEVYTGKAFYGMMSELEDSKYDNSTVIFLHTGGVFNHTF